MKNCKNCLYEKMCTMHLKDEDAERCPSYEEKADYVKVVKCKDCALKGNIIGWCMPQARYVGENEFCSLGRRKEDTK